MLSTGEKYKNIWTNQHVWLLGWWGWWSPLHWWLAEAIIDYFGANLILIQNFSLQIFAVFGQPKRSAWPLFQFFLTLPFHSRTKKVRYPPRMSYKKSSVKENVFLEYLWSLLLGYFGTNFCLNFCSSVSSFSHGPDTIVCFAKSSFASSFGIARISSPMRTWWNRNLWHI